MKQLPPPIVKLLDAAAEKHGITPELARAVAWVESRGNPRAVSSAGAQGVMQLMPATAKGLGVADPFDAASNIDAGVGYLSKQIRSFGDLNKALAAYNWGPNNVKHRRGRKVPESVERYIAKVKTRMAAERGDSPTPARPTSPPASPPASEVCEYCKPEAVAVVVGSLAGLGFIYLMARRLGR